MTSPTSDPDFASRRATPTARSWASSDTITGRYAEASRLRRTGRRRGGPSGPTTKGRATRRPRYTFSSSRGADWDPSRPPRRTAFETDMDQLRTGSRTSRPVGAAPPVRRGSPAPPAGRVSAWGAGPPSTGVPTKRAARACGRPLCANCYATVPDGPLAHQCPDCRGVPPSLSDSEGSKDARGGGRNVPRPREPIVAATRPSWLESP